jgi:hypothetical protein
MPVFCDSNRCEANDFITVERLQMLDQIVLTIDNLILNSVQQGNRQHFFYLYTISRVRKNAL